MGYIEELCAKHFINEHGKIRREYLRYKSEHIDTLDFVDDTMLMVYEHAFFFHFTRIKYKSMGKINMNVFRAALGEIKKKYVFIGASEEKREVFVCNLYSICNPL